MSWIGFHLDVGIISCIQVNISFNQYSVYPLFDVGYGLDIIEIKDMTLFFRMLLVMMFFLLFVPRFDVPLFLHISIEWFE